jgi:pyruvate/2-oxoacid:ferredoxin oxidoreductase alpha subunit
VAGSGLVVDDLDVVPVGVEDERGVVTRVVDAALTGAAVVFVTRGERGGVERSGR